MEDIDMATKFKIDFDTEYKMFDCLIQSHYSGNVWLGGEFFGEDQIDAIIKAGIEDGDEFCGFTRAARVALTH